MSDCHACIHAMRSSYAHLYKIDQHVKDYKRAKNEFQIFKIETHAQDGMVAIDQLCKTLAERLPEIKECV